MTREELIGVLGSDWTAMMELMASSLGSDVALLNKLNESILENSGKMLRPILALLCARLTGKVTEESIKIAAASQMLHNATLLHDDVADDSLERRGKPTVMSLIGPSSAVLVGDFWLARAVNILLDVKDSRGVFAMFSKTLSDLAEGEMLQLDRASSAETSEEDYKRIIYCKTASLFETACVGAATLSGGSEELVNAVRTYSVSLGMAFQIKDDILDYVGDDKLGKPLGVDIKEQKITLPLFGAMRNSDDETRIRGMVRDIHDHPEYAEQIKEFVKANDGVAYAEKGLEAYIEEAIGALAALPDSEEKRYLVDMAEYNRLRKI